jgi:hypothetical protein
MKRLLPLLAIVLLCTASCKKLIEEKKEDMMMKIIQSGEWYVEQYVENGTNVTSEFLNYKFRFTDDLVVKGILGTDTTKGTWEGSINAETITSYFNSDAPSPLPKLNGVWDIMGGYTDYVKAQRLTGAGLNTLLLRKIQ